MIFNTSLINEQRERNRAMRPAQLITLSIFLRSAGPTSLSSPHTGCYFIAICTHLLLDWVRERWESNHIKNKSVGVLLLLWMMVRFFALATSLLKTFKSFYVLHYELLRTSSAPRYYLSSLSLTSLIKFEFRGLDLIAHRAPGSRLVCVCD